MENPDEVDWDIIIVGTGLQETLLALALSRCDKKILHVDKNGYYGGDVAALNLEDAKAWAAKTDIGSKPSGPFSNASTQECPPPTSAQKEAVPTLGLSRKYSLALAPQLIYARSSLLSTLVSARVDTQLDFLAMGNWFLCSPDQTDVVKVPTGREDLFADQTIDAKSKRSLIKFLRFVSTLEQGEETWRQQADPSFAQFLQHQFNLAPRIQEPLGALTMSQAPQTAIATESSLRRIARHIQSTGHLGPNFAAVTPKFGGLAEVTQVACRACAVGGATYILGEGVESQTVTASDVPDGQRIHLKLSTGQTVKARHVVYGDSAASPAEMTEGSEMVSKLTAIVSSPLETLFPALGEDAPRPAGAVVRVFLAEITCPITIIVHSSDTGDCPTGQSVCYASCLGSLAENSQLLEKAVSLLLTKADAPARVLWKLQYEQRCAGEGNTLGIKTSNNGHIVTFPPLSYDLVFDDTVLERVKEAWQLLLGPEAEDFMHFDRRGGEDDEQ